MQEPVTTKAKRRHKQQALIYCLLEESTSDQTAYITFTKGEKKAAAAATIISL